MAGHTSQRSAPSTSSSRWWGSGRVGWAAMSRLATLGRDGAGQQPEPSSRQSATGVSERNSAARASTRMPGVADRRRSDAGSCGGDDEGGQGIARPGVTGRKALEVADGDQHPDPGGRHRGQPRAEHGPSRQPVPVRHHQPDPQIPPKPVRSASGAARPGRPGSGYLRRPFCR